MTSKEKKLTPMQEIWIIAMYAHEASIAGKEENLLVEKAYFKKLSGVKKLQKFHNDLIDRLVSQGYINVSGKAFYALSDKARKYAKDRFGQAESHAWVQPTIMYIAKSAPEEKTA